MKIKIVRVDANDKGIFGHLSIEGDKFECVTLERHDMAIPAGTYKVTLYQSPSKGLVPILNNVPGRTFIEIHAGNYEKDSLGCILVGEKRDGDAIDYSKKTLAVLLEKIKAAKEEVWLTIK